MKKTLLVILMAMMMVGMAFAANPGRSSVLTVSSDIEPGEGIEDSGDDPFIDRNGLQINLYYNIGGSDVAITTEEVTITEEAKISKNQEHSDGFTSMDIILKAAAYCADAQNATITLTCDGFKKNGTSTASNQYLEITSTPSVETVESPLGVELKKSSASLEAEDSIYVTAAVHNEPVQYTNVGKFALSWDWENSTLEVGEYSTTITVSILAN